MVKKRGLGKGLDALLSAGVDSATKKTSAPKDAAETASADGTLKKLPVEWLQRGKYQPRRDMDQLALEELAESIKAQGVMQPIVVRPIAENRYEIIAGERRWRASQLAGLDQIPTVIREVPDETAIAMALIENIQREDLNPMEEAFALKRLQDEFELTQKEVAEAVGKSRTAVTNTLRLLNLSDEVKTMLEHGDLEMGHARCLLSLEPDSQRQVARAIVAKGLSVRQAEALSKKALQSDDVEKVIVEEENRDIANLQEKLGEQIGVPVEVQHSKKGSGKLVLKYNNLDELDGILAHLQYQAN
ncbi:ParB/RepB/Spo0J family partition protein [Agaribacterium haliotis]|uniref:ParB/RepB/Spo0J family partition protein n=1 Tax=Agaribacterium haliotis TaxID=2013869 RepID=UPI000BB538CF|nr:ParB/RepB/Spo0J family partition protein [Agaribacterium haliotis]